MSLRDEDSLCVVVGWTNMEVSNWLSCIRMILFISALEITPCLLFVVYWFSPVQTFFCNPLYCVDHQAPLTVGFSRQECWSGLPFPSPGYLPHPEILPTSPALPGGFFTTEPGGKPIACLYYLEKYKHKHLPRLYTNTRYLLSCHFDLSEQWDSSLGVYLGHSQWKGYSGFLTELYNKTKHSFLTKW